MSISAPPRPPSPARAAPDGKPLEREEIEALVQALIEEARRETRRRRRRYGAVAAVAVLVGVTLFTLVEHLTRSQTAAPALAGRSSVPTATTNAKIAFVHNPRG